MTIPLLGTFYPNVYVNFIRIKVRDSSAVQIMALYSTIGVNLDGIKEVLGL